MTDEIRNIPNLFNNPIGNGDKEIVPYLQKEPEFEEYDDTAPSTNSGGIVRKPYAWQKYLDGMKPPKQDNPMKLSRNKYGLGELGNKMIQQSTFHHQGESPAEGDEMTSLKGQFESSFQKKRISFKEFMQTNSFGGPQGQTYQGVSPAYGNHPNVAGNLQGINPAAAKMQMGANPQMQQNQGMMPNGQMQQGMNKPGQQGMMPNGQVPQQGMMPNGQVPQQGMNKIGNQQWANPAMMNQNPVNQ